MKAQKTSLIALGIIVVALGAYGITHAQSILAQLQPKVYVAGNYIEAPNSSAPVGPRLGSTQTTALHATAASVTNLGGLFLWDTDASSGFEVAGPAWLLGGTTASTLTTTGTTTLGYTPNQMNSQAVTMNIASTTLCAFQNTTGASLIITSAKLGFAPANSGTATFTLQFGVTTTNQGTSSGSLNMYGATAFATSSAQQIISSTSTGGILFANNNYFVAKATATSTQAGTCHIDYIPF